MSLERLHEDKDCLEQVTTSEVKNVKAKPNNTVTASKNPTEPARHRDAKYNGSYKTTSN